MKGDFVYLSDVRDSLAKIERYTAGTKEEFVDREFMVDAVVRNLEIVGEATKRLSKELRESSPDIPWQQMAGMRDVLIHGYQGVDIETVWRVARIRVPAVLRAINALIDRERKQQS